MKENARILKALIQSYYGNYETEVLQEEIEKAGWETLTKSLQECSLVGFAYHAVMEKIIPLSLPPDILLLWKKHALQVLVTNSLYEKEAALVFKALNNAGIKYVLMKGFSNMEKIYGGTGIRAMSDIDIMVSQEQFAETKHLLEQVGYTYKPWDEFKEQDEASAAAAEERLHEISLVKKQGPVQLNIDLHWFVNRYLEGSTVSSIFPEHKLDWLDHTGTVRLGSTDVCCMGLQTQFLFMIYHYLLHHMLSGTKWLVDICQFLHTLGPKLDWDWMKSHVSSSNLAKLVSIALYLEKDITGSKDNLKAALKSGFPVIKPGSLEFSFYRTVPFQETNIMKRSVVFLMLPASFCDRLKVLSYILFDASASIEGRSPEANRGAVKNLLHIFNRLLSALKKQRG